MRQLEEGGWMKKQLNVFMMAQWIWACSHRGQWLCALEQEIIGSSKGDDVCSGGYITGAEHFVCHSCKVIEGDMNTSHFLGSHEQYYVARHHIRVHEVGECLS